MRYALLLVLIGTMSLSMLPVFGAEISIPLGASKQTCENTNSCYSPSTLNVKIGETVIWINDDNAAHTVTSTKDLFDSSIISSGKSFVFKFQESGRFDYFCMVHPWAKGTILAEKSSNPYDNTESIESKKTAVTSQTSDESLQEIKAKKQNTRSQVETTTETKFKKQSIVERITEIPRLVLKTDSAEYESGNTITITGKVLPVIKKKAVTIQVLNPDGDLVFGQQVNPNKKTGSFFLKVIPGGDIWEESGTYSISAQYYKYAYPDVASFDYVLAESESISDTFQLSVNSNTFEIPYEIEGGVVQDMYFDSETPSLDITFEASYDGVIAIDIPQDLLDHEYGFIMLVDGSEAPFIYLDDGRFEIPFEDGSSQINIISLK